VDPNNPVAAGFWPLSVAFWNDRHGLLAGRIYDCQGCSRSTGAVAITRDGGATWRVAIEGWSLIDDVGVVSPHTAWATAGYRHTRLIRSTDGGRTWAPWPGSEGLSTVALWAPAAGLAASHRGAGLVRWDGVQWSWLRDPCPAETVGLSFPEGANGRGWLACSWEAGAGQEPKGVYATIDGGTHWHPTTLVRPDEPKMSLGSGLSSYGYVVGIAFAHNGLGWLVESRGTFYSTTDAGHSWVDHLKFQEPEEAFGTSAWRMDEDLGFVLMNRPGEMVLERSDDGGRRWTRLARFSQPG
jgi:photosystem II stability/assembly factor-like uncharacterized protein